MRIDKGNPDQKYDDFFDWLRYDSHFAWLLTGIFAFLVYMLTTYGE